MKPKGQRVWLAITILAVVGGLAQGVLAQTATTGVLRGTVYDPQGKAVAGAEVKLLDTATNATRTFSTNEAGEYIASNVSPGSYTLTVTKDGFRTATVAGLNVEVNKSYTVDLKLELGDVTDVIEVQAGVGAEMQTNDAQVGNVLSQKMLRNLPTLSRSSFELLSLQPGTTLGGFNTGGTVTGARSDQNTLLLDGIDVSDNLTGGQGINFTQTPIGVDAVSEFRVTVANPNATFGRSAGGQVTLVSPRGANEFHGVGYWYHQNDNLNANTWTNNRVDSDPATAGRQPIPKAETKDNRVGVSVGGPFLKDKTFFFSNYEVRRFPQSVPFTRVVPTTSLRNGILTFRDSSGAAVPYDLRTSALCGSGGSSACDPRGIGISPTVQAMFALMPAGNDATVPGVDGLNTTGFRGEVPAAITQDAVTFRLDHQLTKKLQFMGRYAYQRNLSPLGGTNTQLDIRDPGNIIPLRALNNRGDNIVGGLDYQITPTWINTFRFGWVRNRLDLIGTNPSAVGTMLGLPATNSSLGPVGLELSGLDEAVDVAAQRARTQLLNDRNIQYSDSVTWIKGAHSISFGGEFRSLPLLFTHNDQVTFLTGPVAQMGGSFLTIPTANRPRTCGGSVTTNCLLATDTGRWNTLYSSALGLVDNVNIVGARDGSLAPLPFGTNLITDTSMHYYQFHFQDTWRVLPSVTVTYGVTYSWLTPPKEALNRLALLIDTQTSEVLSAKDYFGRKEFAARQGQVFNPQIGFLPIADSSRENFFDTDYSNAGPRVAAAWNPSFRDGFFGRLFGDRRTVVRGGFGVVYDRINTVSVILPPAFGIGFGQVLQTTTPSCNASGTPGAPGPGGQACNPGAGAGNRGLSSFRVGVDGEIPTPSFTASASPIVPGVLGASITFATDPDWRTGRNYLIDFTIQRELPAEMLFEVGYVGRLARELPVTVDLAGSPFFFVDGTSGQTFAQAFDNVACVLRGQAGQTISSAFTCPASLQTQPWFENQLPGLGTAFLTGTFPSLFQNNQVNVLFLQMNVFRQLVLGLPAFNNLQVPVLLMRTHGGRSNYHSVFFSLRNRPWHGLQFDVNYTLSKSLDQLGLVQNNVAGPSSSFDLDIDYGPSLFDRRHVVNGVFNYELPFGAGKTWGSSRSWLNRITGGWYLSGIFRAFSGLPLFVLDAAGAFGGSLADIGQAAIPMVAVSSLGAGLHRGVTGSGGVGTGSNPATGGTGLNLFGDPQAAFNSFRRVLSSVDGRHGWGNAPRGLGFWNLDARIGKETVVTERVKVEFSADLFNIFNNVNFANPAASLGNPANFGVISTQFTPPNRLVGSRWVQFGLRVSY